MKLNEKVADEIVDQFTKLQLQMAEKKKGVLLFVDGYGTSGKATLINEVIGLIDPKYYQVHWYQNEKEKESDVFLEKYFKSLPEYGSYAIFDTGYITEIAREYAKKKDGDLLHKRIEEVKWFEKSCKENGYIVVNIFLTISEKEQKKRIKKRLDNKYTEWKVIESDLFESRHFDEIKEAYEKVLRHIPCTTILQDSLFEQAFSTFNEEITNGLSLDRYPDRVPMNIGTENRFVSYEKELTRESYKKELKKLQKQLVDVSNVLHKKGKRVVFAFEGWDAAGKGGSIKRLTNPINPMLYNIFPISSPTSAEKNRHFLWRFWNKIPSKGCFSIFDRTWYGRVLVERVEGFCTEQEYKCAYEEINNFEKYLSDNNCLVVKIWVNVTPEEQLARFNARKDNPTKSWKLTDEDWRNRDKWGVYEEAISDMIKYTSTKCAPWVVLDNNIKYNGRIALLKYIVKELKKYASED